MSLGNRCEEKAMDGEKRLCTFVQISDLHFAEADPSTGDSELQNQPPKWDHWHLFDGFLGHSYRALRRFEYAFGKLNNEEQARLIVTGDLTACAQYDRIPSCNQFRIANDYLASEWRIGTLAAVGLQLGQQEATEFRIPGNHDHWGGNALWSTLPGTIFGGPSLGFYGGFKQTPFVCSPISLRKDCSLLLMGIDSDADTSDYHRLLARGDFVSQLHALERELDKCGKPDGSQIRVLLMHHSPMYWSPNLYKDLQITCQSLNALWKFVREYDIAVILTGHIHLHQCNLTRLNSGKTGSVLEMRCGTTMVRDEVPPGWKSPRIPTYKLPPDTFLVHRLYEVATARGSAEIAWRTDWYLLSGAGFIEQPTPLGGDAIAVWPRPSRRPPPAPPKTPVSGTKMSNTPLTELCSIWQAFVRRPENPRAAEIAGQRREELLAHIYDCDTCSRVRISGARNRTLIAEFIGLDRVLTTDELKQIGQMRRAAHDDEKKAAQKIDDVLKPPSKLLASLPPTDPKITSLMLYQAIQAVTMLAARTVRRPASGEPPSDAPIYFIRDGTLSFPGGSIPSATVIKEIALLSALPLDSAGRLIKWIWSEAGSHSDLFEGFRSEQYEDRVLMIPSKRGTESEAERSTRMIRKRVSIEDSIAGLKSEIATVKRELKKRSGADRERLTWRQESLQGLLRSAETPRTRSQSAKRAKTPAINGKLHAKFSGQVTVISDNSLLPRYSKAVDFELIFGADRIQVSASNIVISANSITVQSDTNYQAVGRFDAATGELDLPVRFLVTGSPYTGDFSFTFDPPLGISTEAGKPVGDFPPKGKRLDQKTGKIVLAGATTIMDDGDVANRTNLMINAVGTIEPVPPQNSIHIENTGVSRRAARQMNFPAPP
jgi:hypothetical protein